MRQYIGLKKIYINISFWSVLINTASIMIDPYRTEKTKQSIVTCMVVRVTKIAGSSLDNLIY
jgi:hypothetical protein